MSYTAAALGQVIRELRDRIPMSQEDFGQDIGYVKGRGAAVSVSRIENGHVMPPHDRLRQIAKTLKTDVATLESLAQTGSESAPSPETDQDAIEQLTFKERLKKLQDEIDTRTTRVTSLADAFNLASTQADEGFLTPFFDVARQIEGAKLPSTPSTLTADEAADPEVLATYRLNHSSAAFTSAIGGAAGVTGGAAVGGAAAFGTFTAVSAFGTASTGAAISSLTGVAASNATLAALGGGSLAAGGAGVAGGAALLAGIVAAPAMVLGVGGVIWMVRRNKQKENEQLDKIREAEAELAASVPSFNALVAALQDGTEILGHVANHGARARQRWTNALPSERPLDWSSLSEGERDRYNELVEVASCEIAVSDTNFEAFMRHRDEDLNEFVAVTGSLLREARDRVEAHV